jgi:hypothetical protein
MQNDENTHKLGFCNLFMAWSVFGSSQLVPEGIALLERSLEITEHEERFCGSR